MNTLVVAACNNEDISWLDRITDWKKHIYYDFHPLGREAFVYLDWIIQNYNDLPEEIVFAQGDALEHDCKFVEHLMNPTVRYYGDITKCNINAAPHDEIPLGSWCDVLGLLRQEEFVFVSGAQLRLFANQIRERTLDFYKAMLSLVYLYPIQNEPKVAYTYERLWPLIFKLVLRSENG